VATNKLLTNLEPGTQYTHGHHDFRDSSAVVTEFISSGLTTTGSYTSNAMAAVGSFGSGGPGMDTATVVGIGAGTGVLIKRYGRKPQSVSRRTDGIAQYKTWHRADDPTEFNYAVDPKTGKKVLAPYIYDVVTLELSWSKDFFVNDPYDPATYALVGHVNKEQWINDGITFPPETVVFRGLTVDRVKTGGFDMYTGAYQASYSRLRWVKEVLDVINPPETHTELIYPSGDFSILPLV
jgi:hypothetical protein